jgi:hypothetical protein
VPNHRPGVWLAAWDVRGPEAIEFAATASLALACLYAGLVRALSPWLSLVVAVVGVAFVETGWLYDGTRLTEGLRVVVPNLGLAGVAGTAAANHVRKRSGPRAGVRGLLLASGAALLLATAVHAWEVTLGPSTALFPVGMAVSLFLDAVYGVLAVSAALVAVPSARLLSVWGRVVAAQIVLVALLYFVAPTWLGYTGGWSLAARTSEFAVRSPAHSIGFWVATGVGIAGWLERGRAPAWAPLPV